MQERNKSDVGSGSTGGPLGVRRGLGRGVGLAWALVGLRLVLDRGEAGVIPEDRRMVWEAGVPGGIPERQQVFCNVRESIPGSSRVAVGDGIADDQAALMDAIRLCPSNQVVWLPAGVYRVGRQVAVPAKGHFTLRGDGPDRTVILADLGKADEVIFLGSGEWRPPAARTRAVVSGAAKGSTSLRLSSTSEIRPGTILLLDQLNDESGLVTSLGSGGIGKFSDRLHDGTRNLSQTVRVVAVTGDVVEVRPPLTWSYHSELAPEVTIQKASVERVGLEDLRVTSVGANVSDFISFYNVNECWLRNVETERVGNTHVFFYQSLNCEVRDCYFHEAYRYTVNAGYGIEARLCTGLLLENNIFYRHHFAVSVYAGSTGCVIGYNLVAQTETEKTPQIMSLAFNAGHGAHGIMNLWEGNVGNGFQVDSYWGSASHQTLFRNWFTGTDVSASSNRKAVSIDRACLYQSLVGNVLGSPGLTWRYEISENAYGTAQPVIYRLGYPLMGSNRYAPRDTDLPLDPRVRETLFRHGNFDYASRRVIWDESVPDRELPASLYLTEKPDWWGAGRWPAIGPDLNPMLSSIPAQVRFEQLLRRPPLKILDRARLYRR